MNYPVDPPLAVFSLMGTGVLAIAADPDAAALPITLVPTQHVEPPAIAACLCCATAEAVGAFLEGFLEGSAFGLVPSLMIAPMIGQM